MHRSRLSAAVACSALLGVLAGCGGSKSSDPTPAPQPGPNPQPEPQPAADPYELDPAKHKTPATPASGRLAGKPFTPDRVELEGDKLTLRSGKDFFADQEIALMLGGGAKPSDGLKLVVRPSQQWTDNIPTLHVSTRGAKDIPDTKFVNDGYALTLELGKMEKGKAAGKIYLCLPGDDKSYLAGTFTAVRKRALNEAPGEDEVPFVRGVVAPPLEKDQKLNVGYVGLAADGKVVSDGAGVSVFEDGSGATRSLTFRPRTAGVLVEKFTPRYDFANLPPGRYLVFARGGAGAAWAWVDVKADSRVEKDLTLDPKNTGAVEVTLPTGERDVRLVPTDLGDPPPSEQFLGQLAFSLDLKGEPKDGTATIPNVPAGKYQVRAGLLRGEVEVMAGKTAMVEVKAKE